MPGETDCVSGMTTIRALEQSDLRQVADVFQRVFRPGSEPAGAALVDFLSRTFVDGPSVDREIPSLVADSSLATRKLGWSPQPDARPAIRRAARWWLRRLELGDGHVAAGAAR
jgi:nucleoside-diphosphate-sugar epimerase